MVDRADHETVRGRAVVDEFGELDPAGRSNAGLAYHKGAVVLEYVDRTASTEIDCSVGALKGLEIDDHLRDAIEAAVASLQPAAQDDRSAVLRARDQGLAE